MKSRSGFFGVVVSALFFAVPILAQDMPGGGAKPQDEQTLRAIHTRMKADINAADRVAGVPDQFGTGCCQITQIPASSFVPRSSTTAWSYEANGYISASTNPMGDQIAFWATLTLPSGTAIRLIDLYSNDTDGDNDITATIRVYTGTSVVSFTDVVSVTSVGSGGYTWNGSNSINHTVDNNVQLGGGQYTVVIFLPSSPTSALQFKAVGIWWNRQISPAPAMQTFNDVAPGDFGYQQIEALFASGITGGCGGSNYCPNATLTRAQMAVFLSKALGLYWPF